MYTVPSLVLQTLTGAHGAPQSPNPECHDGYHSDIGYAGVSVAAPHVNDIDDL